MSEDWAACESNWHVGHEGQGRRGTGWPQAEKFPPMSLLYQSFTTIFLTSPFRTKHFFLYEVNNIIDNHHAAEHQPGQSISHICLQERRQLNVNSLPTKFA